MPLGALNVLWHKQRHNFFIGGGVEIGTLSGAAEVCETCGDFHRPAYRF